MARADHGQATAARRVIRSAWRRSYPGLVAIHLFSVFINLLKLAPPLYVLQILDRIPASRSVETLVMLTAITVAAVLTGVILEVVRRRMFMHWGAWIERHFGPKLVHAGLSTQTAGSAMAPSKALRDLATIRQFLSGSGILAWLDVVWAPLFVVVVYLINPLLASIVLGATVAVLGLGLLQEFLTRSARETSRRAQADSRDWVVAAERNGETIGPLNMAGTLAERWSNSATERLDEGLRARRLFVTLAAAMRFLGRCLRIALLAFGIWLVIKGGMTLGAVVAAGVLGRTAFRAVEKAMLKWRELMVAKRAYLPQDIRLFRGTVRENIARMSQGDFSLVVEAAKLTGLHDIILKLPEGYDTEISEDEPLLSAGQRKGIALARALYGWPQLIMMDEPEPHVDRSARRGLVRALKTWTAQGAIVVVTSQSRTLSKIADKVLLLGSKVDLLDDRKAIAALTRRRPRRSEATAEGGASGNG